MATTENTYTDTTTATHSFTFPYLQKSDVKVSLKDDGGAVTELTKDDTNGYTVQTTAITLTGTAASGLATTDTVRVYRETAAALPATFYPGSAIRSSDLNDNFTQNLYSTQEVVERYLDSKGGFLASTLTLGEDADLVFEGETSNDFETTLTVTDPTADRTITLPDETGTVITSAGTDVIDSAHYVDGSIDLAHMSANSVDSDQYVDGSIDGVHIANDAIDSQHYVDGSIDLAHMSANSVDSDQYVDGSIDAAHLASDSVTTAKITDLNVTTGKLAADAVTAAKIADDVVNSEHYAAASIDTEHIADLNITTAKITDANVTTAKIADNAITIAKVGCEQTTLTDSDSHVPTSGAVVDYVVALMQDAGGFHPILDDQKFPNTNPDPNDDAGTIVSIADAGGLVVNGSGVSTTGRTLGGSTVTINGIDSTLYSTTIAAGKGMLVQTTSTLNTYDYHRLVVDEAGVASAETLVSDFNERYRVNAGEPSSHLTDGDLVFDTSANKMKVYDSSASEWKEIASAGDFKYLYLCPAGGTGAPTIDGSIDTYDLRVDSNSGSAATVTSAAQLMVSVNGVTQQPNTGTSAPSLGFALVDSNTIIFGDDLPTSAEVFIVQFGSALTINDPGDGTVTTAKIASAAVETAKIADDAVTSAKLDTNIDLAGTLDVTGAATFDSTGTFSHAGTTTPTNQITLLSPSCDTGGGSGIFLKTSQAATQNRYGTRIHTIREAANNGASSLVISNENSGATGITEALRIDSSGRVGIGTTSMGSLYAGGDDLVVGDGGASNQGMTIYTGTSQQGILAFADGTSGAAQQYAGYLLYDHSTDSFRAATSGQEAMRIDSSRNVGIGRTVYTSVSTDGHWFDADGWVSHSANGTTAMYLNRNTDDGNLVSCYRSGSYVGGISVTTTATAYNTSSDYRLKDNITAITSGIDRLKQLKPSRFNFKVDEDVTVDGFVAHEVSSVVPEAITGEKDAMKDEEYEVTPAVEASEGVDAVPAVMGTRSVPDYQGIDQAKLVPLLTAALQEAITKIETLETKVAALEAA